MSLWFAHKKKELSLYFRTQLSISYVDVGMFILEEIWKKHGGLIRSAQYESSLPYLQHVSVSFRAAVTTETSVIFSIGNCYIAILITFSDKHSCDFFFSFLLLHKKIWCHDF